MATFHVIMTLGIKSKIMYFHVNVSPPKPLDIATSNFTCVLVDIL